MKKKIVVVSGGGDVPPELLKAIASQSMGEGMGEDEDEYRPEDEDEAGSDPLEKELMSVIKKIIQSC